MREVARPKSHADGPKGPAAGGGSPYAGATGGIGGNWRRSLAPLPAVGAALLPKLTCPACWPAYAGGLGALGLGFVNYSAYLFPLTALFLAVAVASLGWRAKKRRGYAPLVLGIVAAGIVIAGKFVLNYEPAMYGGILLLVGASLWNSWPRRGNADGACPACIPRENPSGAVTPQTESDGRRK